MRQEEPADEDAVRALHLAAFGDHGDLVADLVVDLRPSATASSGVSLVAVDGAEVIGHVLFSPALLDAPPRLVPVQVLSPLAVRPARQRRGVGAALVHAGLQIMAERSVPVVFLEGDPGYYARFGFRPGAEQGFRRPSLRIPAAAFQAFRTPSAEPWMTGTLIYPDTMWRHDAVGLRDPGG